MADYVYGGNSSKIIPGARYGMLTIIRRLPREIESYGNVYKALCKCDCGNETAVVLASLYKGLTKSCGCVLLEKNRQRSRQRAIDHNGIPNKGTKFGRLTIIEREEIDGCLTSHVICKCDCGNFTKSSIRSVKKGLTRSCGCLQSEQFSQRSKDSAKFSGFKKEFSLTYKCWYGIQKRCYNSKTPGYNYYGARGVCICEGLRTDPRNLVNLIGHRESKEITIDRFPIHNGNYTCGECIECRHMEWKKNVRWATQKQQQRNKGDFNVRLTAFGKTRCKSEWIELSGLPHSTVENRLKRGWTVEDAISIPNKLGHGYDPITDKDRKSP